MKNYIVFSVTMVITAILFNAIYVLWVFFTTKRTRKRMTKTELNKKNLLKYYEQQKLMIKDLRDNAVIEETIEKCNNQLELIDDLILDLNYFY